MQMKANVQKTNANYKNKIMKEKQYISNKVRERVVYFAIVKRNGCT